MSTTHPWAAHLNVRKQVFTSKLVDPPSRDPPPYRFSGKNHILPPSDSKTTELRERITLADIIAFRARAPLGQSKKKKKQKGRAASNTNVDDLCDAVGNVSIGSKLCRPVFYRNTDAVKYAFGNAYNVLEAVHFELFMPDRKDLRFIAVQCGDELPAEGDYFLVFEVTLLEHDLPRMNVGGDFLIQWEAVRAHKYPFLSESFDDFVYVVGPAKGEDGKLAVTNWSEDVIRLRGDRFRVPPGHTKDVIYEASLVDTSSAWIYPVEPPKNREQYAQMTSKIRSSCRYEGTYATEIRPLSENESNLIADRLNDFKYFERDPEEAEKFFARLLELGVRYRMAVTPPEVQSVQVLSVDPVKLCTFAIKTRIHAVTLLFDDQKIKLEVNDISRAKGRRYYTTLICRSSADLMRALSKRNSALQWCDALMHSDQGNVVVRHLQKISEDVDGFEDDECYESCTAPISTNIQPALLHALYGMRVKSNASYLTTGLYSMQRTDGRLLKLNEQQSRAMVIYHQIRQPAYCIRSPPGSGKTTVAAAMAASFYYSARSTNERPGIQLLLAVQNVAVDNIGEALAAFDDGYLKAYHMKAIARLDPNASTPYDIFEELPHYERWMRNASDKDLKIVRKYINDVNPRWVRAQNDPSMRLSKKQRDELEAEWAAAFRQAKAALEKYLEPDIILSTVDMILLRLLGSYHTTGLRGQLWEVERVIIDEASLLTESAFYCLIRAFPTAKFVLIGDDQQLPPFMFDEGTLGHELAARSALTVALKKGNIPVVNLVEVYRAPQALVEPYNRLSYEGRLVSRKKDPIAPLTAVGLVSAGRPQLLFVNVRGDSQKGFNSLHNIAEKDALLRLLRLFPANAKNDIMIISLYKDQKHQVERALGPDYDVLTVDSSQGKEKPTVIVLTTRSNEAANMSFFNCQRRCTVAVSRQQRALIIFGSAPILDKNHPWSTVIGGDFTRIEAESIKNTNAAAQTQTNNIPQKPMVFTNSQKKSKNVQNTDQVPPTVSKNKKKRVRKPAEQSKNPNQILKGAVSSK